MRASERESVTASTLLLRLRFAFYATRFNTLTFCLMLQPGEATLPPHTYELACFCFDDRCDLGRLWRVSSYWTNGNEGRCQRPLQGVPVCRNRVFPNGRAGTSAGSGRARS